MQYEPKKTLDEFNALMADVQKCIPEEFNAFLHEKHIVTKSNRIPEKIKWLILLVASVSQRCPTCIPRAVQHCLDSGWTKEEMLEACMVAVLVGGSSVMTYVTLVDKSIEEFAIAGAR